MWNNFWQQIGIAHYCYKLTFKFIVQLILQNSSTKFMECSMNTRTVTVSQVTKDTSATTPPPPHPLPQTNNYLTWIIFLVLFLTRIILLHAYPQVEYCTCVKFHQNWFIYLCGLGLAKKYGQTDWRGQIPIYLPKQLCLQEYYNDSTMNWCILGCSCKNHTDISQEQLLFTLANPALNLFSKHLYQWHETFTTRIWRQFLW